MKFIIFDIETTSPYKETGKIIEIAALKVEDWKVIEEYDQLIDPQCKIPQVTTNLTGIKDKDVDGQPIINDVLSSVLQFIGDWPLVGHNIVSFDKPFIEYNLQQLGIGDQIDNNCLDTMELAIFLKPEFKKYKLEFLHESFLGKKTKQKHRAIDDCRMLLDVLLKLKEVRDREWDKTWLDHVGSIAKKEDWAWADFILDNQAMNLGKQIDSYLPVEKFIEEIDTSKLKVNDKNEEEKTTDSYVNINPEEIRHYFGEDKPRLKKILGGNKYEYREPQNKMATKIAESVNQDKHLVAEAPTGCGKSLAYLVPCVMWSLKNDNKPVVISTYTNVLQDQLFENDFAELKTDFDTAKVTIAKGREHYICLRKLRKFFNESATGDGLIKNSSRFPQRLLSVFLANWVIKNKDNNCDFDRFSYWLKKEINGFNERMICSDRYSCQRRFCPFYKKCFINKLKLAVYQSNIVITNHSLLFSNDPWDSVHGLSTLPKNFKILVIDEAINIEDAATSGSTSTFDQNEFKNLLLEFFDKFHPKKNFLNRVKLFLNKKKDGLLLGTCEKIEVNVSNLISNNNSLFDVVKNGLGDYKLKYDKKEEITENFLDDINIKTIIENIGYNLKEISNFLASIYSKYQEQEKQEKGGFCYEIRGWEERLEEYINFIGILYELNKDKYIFWKEIQANLDDFSLNFCYKNIGEYLENKLYKRDFKSIIFTSATLSYNNSFDFTDKIWGLNKIPSERLDYLKLDYLFDYSKQCILFLIKDLPRKNYENGQEKNNKEYYLRTVDFLKKSLIANSGSSLILFSNKEDVARFSSLLVDNLESNNIPLFSSVKSEDVRIFSSNLSTLAREFRDNAESCLIGTAGLREGIDVPGPSLEIVFIVKLPFGNPRDPITKNRSDIYGGFEGYTVPVCILNLKQAFGRLIRSKKDEGFVFLIDAKTGRYKNNIINNLPENLSIHHVSMNYFDNLYKIIKNTKYKNNRIEKVLKHLKKDGPANDKEKRNDNYKKRDINVKDIPF